MYNSNFKYFISTQKKWTEEEIPLKILIYVYVKNQENLYFKRITLLIKPHSRQADHVTQNQRHWATATALALPAPFFWLHHTDPRPLSFIQTKTSSLSSHSAKGMKKNQTANFRVDFSINLQCGLTNTKKLNIYRQCSFARK